MYVIMRYTGTYMYSIELHSAVNPCWLPAVVHFAITEDLDGCPQVTCSIHRSFQLRHGLYLCMLCV